MRIIGIFAAGVLIVGCAGRSPQPVAVVQPQDTFMDCTAIIAEVQSNNQKVQELASEKGMKTTQNVAAGVAGIFIPVLWFEMDFQGTQDKEISALQSLQQYLASRPRRGAAEAGSADRSASGSEERGKGWREMTCSQFRNGGKTLEIFAPSP